MFTTLTKLLQVGARLGDSDEQKKWYDLAYLLVKHSDFPNNETPNIILECGDPRFAYSYWKMLEPNSRFSNQIIEYLVNIGMNPNMKYLDYDTTSAVPHYLPLIIQTKPENI